MDLNKTSRFISLILRHRPDTIGISLDEHGWTSNENAMSDKGRYHSLYNEVDESHKREREIVYF